MSPEGSVPKKLVLFRKDCITFATCDRLLICCYLHRGATSATLYIRLSAHFIPTHVPEFQYAGFYSARRFLEIRAGHIHDLLTLSATDLLDGEVWLPLSIRGQCQQRRAHGAVELHWFCDYETTQIDGFLLYKRRCADGSFLRLL